MNFFFSHLPARVEALACGMWRAIASMSARVCSATEMALPPGVFITRTPAAVAASRSTLSTPTPARPMTRSLGAFCEHRLVHLDGAAHQQRVGLGQVLRVFLGIGNDGVPAGLRLKQLDPGRSERLGN